MVRDARDPDCRTAVTGWKTFYCKKKYVVEDYRVGHHFQPRAKGGET